MAAIILDPNPRGWNDLYWCGLINEVFFSRYQNDHPHCPHCGWEDKEATKHEEWPRVRPSEKFLEFHKFLGHVPKYGKSWEPPPHQG